jgi:deoxyribonuclease V
MKARDGFAIVRDLELDLARNAIFSHLAEMLHDVSLVGVPVELPAGERSFEDRLAHRVLHLAPQADLVRGVVPELQVKSRLLEVDVQMVTRPTGFGCDGEVVLGVVLPVMMHAKHLQGDLAEPRRVRPEQVQRVGHQLCHMGLRVGPFETLQAVHAYVKVMHDWDVLPKGAIAIQKELRARVRIEPLKKGVSRISGADVSMDRFAKDGYAGFVTLSFPHLEVIDHSVVHGDIPFPYIPRLLSFREIPLLLKAWESLTEKPDVLMVDGVGIAHPRRLGIASHLGLMLDVPTIGCAKSVLVGTYEEPGIETGSFSYLHDNGEVVGAALRTKRNVKPMFISVGHKITLEEAIALARASVIKHRIPEPTRRAHLQVNAYRVKGKAS